MFCCVVSSLLILILLIPVSQADEKEDTLKMAIVLKVAKFIRSNASKTEEYTIALAANGDVKVSAEIPDGVKLHRHPVRLQHLDSPQQLTTQQLVFLPKMSHEKLQRWMQQAKTKGILTISDMRGFAQAGGMVQLYRASRKFRLKINLTAIRNAGLDVRSTLLKIAQVIRE